jgi:cyclohexadieny/prephenate dehydrogenase
MFQKVAFLGIGLIGASLALAMRTQKLAGTITAMSRTAATAEKALALGIVDSASTNAMLAVQGADLVVLAAPVGAYAGLLQQIAPVLERGVILTDVGSVKQSVIEQVMPLLPDHAAFVPGHPIAGTEYSGPEAGFATLFQGRWCLLTPPPSTPPTATTTIQQLWEAVGAKVAVMDAEHHDLVLAITSHIPHLIAYTIVGTGCDLEETLQGEVMKYSAGGFRDFTRIAASDPTMWRDIFLHNKEAVLEMLGRFTEDLTALQKAIRLGDGDQLFHHFSRTRAIRRGIIAEGQA